MATDSPTVSTSTERYSGRVKWFNNKNGYGFISSKIDDEDLDIFVHHSELSTDVDQFRYLLEGEYVEFSLNKTSDDDEKISAQKVKGLDGGKLMCETKNDRKLAMSKMEDGVHRPRRNYNSGPRSHQSRNRLVIPSPDGDGSEWELVRRRPRPTRPSSNQHVVAPTF